MTLSELAVGGKVGERERRHRKRIETERARKENRLEIYRRAIFLRGTNVR